MYIYVPTLLPTYTFSPFLYILMSPTCLPSNKQKDRQRDIPYISLHVYEGVILCLVNNVAYSSNPYTIFGKVWAFQLYTLWSYLVFFYGTIINTMLCNGMAQVFGIMRRRRFISSTLWLLRSYDSNTSHISLFPW